jgi:hypothetical protein
VRGLQLAVPGINPGAGTARSCPSPAFAGLLRLLYVECMIRKGLGSRVETRRLNVCLRKRRDQALLRGLAKRLLRIYRRSCSPGSGLRPPGSGPRVPGSGPRAPAPGFRAPGSVDGHRTRKREPERRRGGRRGGKKQESPGGFRPAPPSFPLALTLTCPCPVPVYGARNPGAGARGPEPGTRGLGAGAVSRSAGRPATSRS